MTLLVAGAKDRVRPSPSLRARRLKKFLSYYRPYLGWLFADLACAFVVSGTTLALPLCVNAMTKGLLGKGVPDHVWMLGGLMLGLVIAQVLCNAFVDYQGHMMGARMEGDMRVELFDHYQKLSFGFYDSQRTGQLMARLTHDPLSLAELYHHGPEDLAIAAIKSAGVVAILLRIDVPLTLLVLGFLPLMAAYAFVFNRRMNRALRQSKDRIGDINAQVEDSLAGIRVVQAFANEAVERAQFSRANRRFLDSRRDGYRSEAWFYAGMTAFTQLITVTVIVVGAAGILRARLDFADLLTFLLCVSILVDPVQRLVNFVRLYQEGITGFDRFMDMLEIEPDIQDAPNAQALDRIHGHVEFCSVSFRYRDDTPHVVRDLSLDIAPGDFVALVGASGVGKTTLCSLIPRFYETTEGDIRIDGHRIRDLRLDFLRRNIGIVQQDVYLFAGSVADNLRYGKLDATPAEIVAAAKKAQAHDFIMALPQGYETDIGERGVKLSGGQKQRLAIARVFLKDPPILILDEATSALDAESESAVQRALQSLARGRTTLVIAHRLSTIRKAQRIVVLTDKGIAEQGTHEALIAAGGAYANLYQAAL
jgi:ATP-binding cassette subfamily B protein